MIFGCSQPRELWFIDFHHVHVSHLDLGEGIAARVIGQKTSVHIVITLSEVQWSS